MFVSRRFWKMFTTTVIGAVAAFALSTGLGERQAHAQISGSIGGDVIASALSYTLNNTMISGYVVQLDDSGRARIAADVTTEDELGQPQTTRIIAVLIGLFAARAPGFMDYTDDACMVMGGGAPGAVELEACAMVGHAFRAFVQQRRLEVSPVAVLSQSARGIFIWDQR